MQIVELANDMQYQHAVLTAIREAVQLQWVGVTANVWQASWMGRICRA